MWPRFCWYEQMRKLTSARSQSMDSWESGEPVWGPPVFSISVQLCLALMRWLGSPSCCAGHSLHTRTGGWVALPWGKFSSNLASSGPVAWRILQSLSPLCCCVKPHLAALLCKKNVFNNIFSRTNFYGQDMCWFLALIIYVLFLSQGLKEKT